MCAEEQDEQQEQYLYRFERDSVEATDDLEREKSEDDKWNPIVFRGLYIFESYSDVGR